MQTTFHPAQDLQGAGIALQMLNGTIKATTQAKRSKLPLAALTSIHRIGEPALAGFAVVIFNLMDKGMRI